MINKKFFNRVIFTFIIILSGVLLDSSLYLYASGYEKFSLRFEKNFSISAQRGYDLINWTGRECLIYSSVGCPRLPMKQVRVAVPMGFKFAGIRISTIKSGRLKGKFKVYPSQPSIPLSVEVDIPFNEGKPEIYNSMSKYPLAPVEFASEQVLAGQKIVLLKVYPMQYIPGKGELYFNSYISFIITFKEDLDASFLIAPVSSPKRENIVKSLVLNAKDINKSRSLSGDRVEYLLITDSNFVDEFQPLAEWHTQTGVPAEIITTGYIYSNYPGFDNQKKIQNCIRDYYQDKGLVYVLLGGDVAHIPDRDCYVSVNSDEALLGNWYTETNMPSDIYYSALADDNWDDDGDGRFGEYGYVNPYMQTPGTWQEEVSSYEPDVFVGRVSIETEAQVTGFVNKVLTYIKNPSSTDFARKYLLAGCRLFNPLFWGNDIPPGYNHAPVSDAEIKCDILYNDYIAPGWPFEIHKFYDTFTSFDTSSAGDYHLTNTHLVLKFNDGYNFFYFATHGLPLIWSMESGSSFSVSDALSCSNFTKPGIIYTIACNTNSFDSSICLSEAFIRNPFGGAVAYMGCSRYGFGDMDPLTLGTSMQFGAEFHQQIYIGNRYILGEAFALHKEAFITQATPLEPGPPHASLWLMYGFNLLGDPAMPLWTDDPSELTPAYPETVVTGTQTIEINTGLDGARVCLWKEDEVYIYGTVDESGDYIAEINPTTSGIIKLTITAQNYKPFVSNITVIDAPFVELISPNGGEEWAIGSSHSINWSSIGIVDNVKIEYSINNGSSWLGINSSTANDGSYNWTIPGGPSDNCLVRVSEIDGDPSDESDAVFLIYIPPSITVTSPNGGENWTAGSSFDITWTSAGTVGDVTIEYSIDNGSSWTAIIESTINDGIFNWTVPNNQSDNCLVRVSETDGDPTDVSDTVFSIYVPPSIIVTSPNGGENWQVGASQYITWTSFGTVGNVKIEYSIDNGSSWADIVTSTPNNGSYNWTVPGNTSDNCLVRVSETDGEPSDVSDAVFSIVIPSSITVTSPNGGENWEVGSSYNITWTFTGTVGNLTIQYSFNGGTSWSNIVKSTENDGSYNWTVPDTPSGNCLVRISEKGEDSYPSGVSDAVFSIVSPLPTITVTSPNGRESLAIGLLHEITWSNTGTIGNVLIEYSADSGATWKGIVNATENNGSYNWTVPDDPSDHCLVRIRESGEEGAPSDISNGEFSIIPPQEITITYPNGGETLISGLIYKITWIGSDTINNVKIEYSTNGGTSWTETIVSTPNDGSHEWTIPNVQENPSDNCLVRVSDTDGDPLDVSDAVFSIVWPSSITVTSPNGGESLEAGSSFDITWTGTGDVDNVSIEYSVNSGASWTAIVKSTGNSGTYNWTVPGNPSGNCLVRVRESDGDGGPWDISDTEFSITTTSYTAITVISPNGGETLYTGSTYEINWTGIGIVGNVKIEYSTNSGTSWTEIVESISNDGIYEWTVPDAPSDDCLIRVSETDGDPSDDSDARFEITTDTQPSVTVTSPNGGENLTVGSTHDITWTSTGTIDNVIIEYSTDEGASWTNIETSAVNNGSYNWTVPGTPSGNCLVRISDVDEDTGLWDVSDAVFFIAAPTSAAITVTSPNRGESLVVGSIHEITWTGTGEIENVKVEYSTDNGTTWIEIIKSVSNNGRYDWAVPDDPSNDCLVRISGADTDDAPWDVSDVVFSLVSDTTYCGETWISANYSGSTLTFVTYGSSKFAAVGNGGTIMTGSNGIGWTPRSSGTNEDIHGIVYGGNTFAAVGDSGIILTSPDGITWELQSSNTSLDLRGIAYGGENFVAVGVQGVILNSPDGITWESQSAGTTNDLFGITYGAGRFTAVGNSGTILTSTDGINWTKRPVGTTKTIYGIAYGGDKFMAVGADGVILTSSNGTSWDSRNSVISIDLLNAAYSNSIYVIVGRDGKISTSSDGIEWTARSSGVRNDLFGIVYNNSRFVAVGAGTILYSLCQ